MQRSVFGREKLCSIAEIPFSPSGFEAHGTNTPQEGVRVPTPTASVGFQLIDFSLLSGWREACISAPSAIYREGDAVVRSTLAPILALTGTLLLIVATSRSALAAPVQVQVTGFSGDIFVELEAVPIGGTPFGNPLDVVGNTVTFDPAVPRVDDFSILLQGDASSLITLSQAVDIGFGPIDEILVNSALLTSIVTATYPAFDLGDGLSFQFSGVPNLPLDPVADVTSSLVLSYSGGGVPLVVDPYDFPLDSLVGNLFFTGFALGDTLDFGLVFPIAEILDVNGDFLQVKADVVITGTVVPEPGTALLLLTGLAALGATARRRG